MKYICVTLSFLVYLNAALAPTQGQYIEVNNIKIYYEIAGEGPNLVILHGNGGSTKSKAHIIPKLTNSFRVIAFDNRGHGKSDDGEGDLNYRQMADDISKAMIKLNIKQANIWGHSDGGIIALIIGFTHPELVNRMIVSGANYTNDEYALEPALEKIVERYDEISIPKMKRQIKMMAYFPTILKDELNKIEAPVLVMSGDRDAIQLEHTISLFREIKNSQLFVLPGTTHFIDREKPEHLIQTIHSFFTKPFTMPSTIDIAEQIAKQILKKEE